MNKLRFTIALLPFLWGCTLLFPRVPEINPVYLKDLTPEQTSKLDGLKKEIVEEKNAQKEAERLLSVTRQQIRVNEAHLKFLDTRRDYLNEQDKLCLLTGNEKRRDVLERINENQVTQVRERARGKYLKALADEQEAQVEERKARLDYGVARLKMEEAIIGSRKQKALGVTEKSREFIKLDDYRRNVNTRETKLNETKETHKLRQSRLKEARLEMDAAGGTAENKEEAPK